MQRYFFHLRKRDERLPDAEGILLADEASAHALARKVANELGQPWFGVVNPEYRNWRIEVCDEERRILATVAVAANVAAMFSEPVATHAGARHVVYLDDERRRRQLASVASQMHQLIERMLRLCDEGLYEAKKLHTLINDSEVARHRSCEVLERSRQQSQMLRDCLRQLALGPGTVVPLAAERARSRRR